MENATKALYMAIGVFIGILILTAFVFVFVKGGSFLGTAEEKEITRQLEEYNADLIIYQKDNNTIYDVISACNLAYDINKQNDYDNVNYLIIKFEGTEDFELENKKEQKKGYIGNKSLTELITQYGGTVSDTSYEYKHKFEGEVSYSKQTGKINLITFKLK